MSRCNHSEDESIVLSRFRAGLREDLQRELFLREVLTLQQAYQLVQDLELYSRPPNRRFDTSTRSYQPTKPTPSQPTQFQAGSQSKTPVTQSNKGKSIISKDSGVECYRCHKFGHYAAQCPNRNLLIDEQKEDTDNEEDVYEPPVDHTYSDGEAYNDRVGFISGVISSSVVPSPDIDHTQLGVVFHNPSPLMIGAGLHSSIRSS